MAEQKPTKAQLKEAQARHQSALFGGATQKPTSQQAEHQAKERGGSLTKAAQQKQRDLSGDETRKLEELRARSQAGKTQSKSHPQPKATQKSVDPSVQQLHEVTRRSDLAAEAVSNMQQNLKKQEPDVSRQSSESATQPRPQQSVPTPRPAQPTESPAPQPAAAPRPAQPQADQPVPLPQRPAAGGRRPAPSPEELDTLLREMARRSAARRAAGGAPPAGARPSLGGPERPEAAPASEAPPPPPEVEAAEKQNPEKHAEILKGLQAKEAAAQRDIKPIPQSDQERAEEKAVEASVSIRTEGNSISAAPLHEAISELQKAMRVHDAVSEVEGVNHVQRTMPQHPLYSPKAKQGSDGA